MGEDHCGGVVLQGPHSDFTGIHRGAIEGAEEQVLAAQHPVLAVKEQTAEHLAPTATEMQLQKGPGLVRVGQGIAIAQRTQRATPRELEGGLKLRIGGRPDSGTGYYLLVPGKEQIPETTEAPQQCPRRQLGAVSAVTPERQHAQQLGVGQCVCPGLQKLVSRALSSRPLTNAHCAPPWSLTPQCQKPCVGVIVDARNQSCSSGSEMAHLFNRNILLGISGGIAAYKSAELVRQLQQMGGEVRVIMTRGATEFITPLTLQALSGHPVHSELLDTEAEMGMGHIELARWADLLVIAPATADLIARLAAGRADDLLTTVALATPAPLLLAPAMNQQMWRDPATGANITTLESRGMRMIGPAEGVQACGDTGPGRMEEPQVIAEATRALFASGRLAGRRVVVTAGPTREPIDPVRYLSNHSSGKMGFALARAAVDAGAVTSLVSGPATLPTPDHVRRYDVGSAREMLETCLELAPDCDIFIACAAVADYRPATMADQKIKKGAETITMTLERNPDIVATIAALPDAPFTVGFAAETQAVEDYAREKRVRKGLDMIVANDVAAKGIGFNSDENAVTVFWESGQRALPRASKSSLAAEIVDLVAAHISGDL